jgi:hypothetical protein
LNIKNQTYNTLISFKLKGLHFQKLNEYCDARGFNRSELLREFVENVVTDKAPGETNAG